MKLLISLFIFTLIFSCASSVKQVAQPENNNESVKPLEKPVEKFFQKPFLKKIQNNESLSLQQVAKGKLLFIDFSIENCEPCRKLDTYIEKMKERYENRVSFIKITNKESSFDDKSDQFYIDSPIEKEEWIINEYPSVIIYSLNGEENVSFEGLYPILYYMSAIEEMLQ